MKEDIELLDLYLEGALSDHERMALEARLLEDETLRALLAEHKSILEGIKATARMDVLKSLRTLEATLPEHETKIVPLWQNKWLLIAASVSIIILISFILFWPQSSKTDQLFAQYFERYPNIIFPVTRGDLSGDTSSIAKAYQAYDHGDCTKAINLFNKVSEADEVISFYLANAYLCNNEITKAQVLLLQIKEAHHSLEAEASWYLALCYLKGDNIQKTVAELEHVIQLRRGYVQEAEELTNKLIHK
jgi:hypothetical protein